MKILVWDWPTRLFHWLLAGAFGLAWLTAENDRWLDVHVFAGYTLAALVAFRLLWGILGSRYAKFASFAFHPRAAYTYAISALRGKAKRYIGHNPAGSWAIYLLLLSALLIASSGVLVLGGEEQQGPLAGIISIAAGERLKALHEFLAYAMLGLVALHLLGVVVESRLHRENLARAMLTGHKRGAATDGIPSSHAQLAGILLAALSGFSVWYFFGYFSATEKQPYLPYTGPALGQNATWRSECGSCHLAYHPSLLPTRSWQRMLREQNQHFGEALDLDTDTVTKLMQYAARHAAEGQQTEAAYKINRSTQPTVAPLRITETRYWQRKHRDIAEEIWRGKKVGAKANCPACHLDAESGRFEDASMRIP